jgi:hypothetical protein
MTDLQLLELAAKAAGIPDGYWNCEHHDHGHGEYWNPLEDDGDALRLAVKLEIDLCFGANYVIAFCVQEPTVNNADDPCAAVRRAIVLAAVEFESFK